MRFEGRRISMQLQAGRQATAERPTDVTVERGVAGGIEVVSCDNLCFLNTGDGLGSLGAGELGAAVGRRKGKRSSSASGIGWDDSGLNGQVSVSSEAGVWSCR